MKIVQINPGILKIPPNGWGAIEKIIWEYTQYYNSLPNVTCDIKNYWDIGKTEYDIVHVHAGNQATALKNLGIPYIFSLHDHHVCVYGKGSHVYNENLEGIKGAALSIVHAEFLIDFYENQPNMIYLPHGVNTDEFKFTKRDSSKHSLLCVAANGFAYDKSYDRKGFKLIIEASKKLNLPLVLAGPTFTMEEFKSRAGNILDNVTFKYDLTEEELKEEYKQHTIFVNPSILEAGHPNLTILEALSTGMPVVSTCKTFITGHVKCERSLDSVVSSIVYTIMDYDMLTSEIESSIQLNSWNFVCSLLLKHYLKISKMREQLLAEYESTQILGKESIPPKNNFIASFVKGAKIEITGDFKCKYNIEILNDDTNTSVYKSEITNNMWAMTGSDEYINWKIIVTDEHGNTQYFGVDLENKPVAVTIAGDSKIVTQAVDVISKFALLHGCIIYCVVNENVNLDDLYPLYPDIAFYTNAESLPYLYAHYTVKHATCGNDLKMNYENDVIDYEEVVNNEPPVYVDKLINVQILHLLSVPEETREILSSDNILKLSTLGYDYKRIVNTPYNGEIDHENCARPDDIADYPGDYKLTKAHYGCYLAHKDAISSLTNLYDCTLIVECDSYFEGSPTEIKQVIDKAYKKLTETGCKYISLTDAPTLSPKEEDGDYYKIKHQNGTWAYLIRNEDKYWFMEMFKKYKWDIIDLFFNHVFHSENLDRYSTKVRHFKCYPGISLIDKKVKYDV